MSCGATRRPLLLLLTVLAFVNRFAISVPAFKPKHHVDKSVECDVCNGWELVAEVTIGSGTIPVRKYRSKTTGIRVALAKAESPIVNGYFCLATEAFNDDGLPHTLEHLVFLGSEDYPYKEVLDLLANRCLADRTNAWTETDHTCYTVYTAGTSGFKTILPIYMDHILFPLLKDDGFITEVHHVTGRGKDAGVVYSEMQAKEHRPGIIMAFEMAKLIYPGNSSYHSETGGKLMNLRKTTTIEKVRWYHEKYYRPENLYITITGNLSPEELFEALQPVEEKILRKRKQDRPEKMDRPFQHHLDQLTEDVVKTVEFPSDDEQFAWVKIGWRIPGKLVENVERITSLNILASYLTSTSVSPLTNTFVDSGEPLATSIDFDVYGNWEPAVVVDFLNVPVEKMDVIEPTFKKVINKIIDDGPEEFNINRIRNIVDRMILARRMNVENSPHLVVPDGSVYDLLYSTKPDHFETLLRQGGEKMSKRLLRKPSKYWINLLNETISGPQVLLKGMPSMSYNKQVYSNETTRISQQIESLEEKGLKTAGEKVRNAIKNQTFPPNSVLKSVPVADINSITYRKLTYYNYTTEKQPEKFDLKSIPFRFHLDDIDSSFVRFYVFLDMAKMSQEDRSYMVLLTEMWLQCPVKNPDGTLTSLEDLFDQRSTDAMSFYNDIGFKGSTYVPGSQSHLLMFYAEAKLEKYKEAITMMKRALFDVEFTMDRARSIISQLLNGIPSLKHSASSVVNTVYDDIYFDSESFLHHASFLRQKAFLQKAKEKLKDEPALLLAKLHDMRRALVQPNNTFVYVASNLSSLTDRYGNTAASLWETFFDQLEPTTAETLAVRYPTTSEHEHRNPKPSHRHAIVGLPGTESCYLMQAVEYDNTDWELQEVAAARIMLQYLTDRMYDQIRGQGWTYGVGVSLSITEGRLRVHFSRSSRLGNAYTAFRNILRNYTKEENAIQWDPVLLDSARGSLIYNWVEVEETPESLAGSSVLAYLRQTNDPYYARRFVRRLAEVRVEDVQKVAEKYLPRFFDPEKTHTAVVCAPNAVDDVKTLFKKFKFTLNEIKDLELEESS